LQTWRKEKQVNTILERELDTPDRFATYKCVPS
jgi:hypothetical protein